MVLIGIEHVTAKHEKAPGSDKVTEGKNKSLACKKVDDLFPIGAVDLTPTEEDGDEG
jgi:hypothetical protein